jgi:hypothetical protein|tara:strand:- start:318 stop:1094 length:777 start_codon:yes stop_codon:yes gene_type:complete
MDVTKKVLIMVTGSYAESENYKECEKTWMPLLRKMGFKVLTALGNREVQEYGVLTSNDFENYYKFLGKNTIEFRTFDDKRGLFDKSIKLPAKWILEETDYEYYFRIDSDSFVHPMRFKQMLEDNLKWAPDLDYMGCCHPWMGWNPHRSQRYFICRTGHMAAGCGYLVSRRAMRVAQEKMKLLQPSEFILDDWVLGRAMWENGIQLLHDSRICFESKHKRVIRDYVDVGVPDITEEESHLAIQHYMNGHMMDAIKKLKL